ncbi:collagen alpha-1(I) chain-like [Eschrichtius robustus]|uniref:collagen alpha-1(I) chain-like n=1 Tax=Eschrichtius robustus TaxID=9764 RepID=UPI0035C0D5D5
MPRHWVPRRVRQGSTWAALPVKVTPMSPNSLGLQDELRPSSSFCLDAPWKPHSNCRSTRACAGALGPAPDRAGLWVLAACAPPGLPFPRGGRGGGVRTAEVGQQPAGGAGPRGGQGRGTAHLLLVVRGWQDGPQGPSLVSSGSSGRHHSSEWKWGPTYRRQLTPQGLASVRSRTLQSHSPENEMGRAELTAAHLVTSNARRAARGARSLCPHLWSQGSSKEAGQGGMFEPLGVPGGRGRFRQMAVATGKPQSPGRAGEQDGGAGGLGRSSPGGPDPLSSSLTPTFPPPAAAAQRVRGACGRSAGPAGAPGSDWRVAVRAPWGLGAPPASLPRGRLLQVLLVTRATQDDGRLQQVVTRQGQQRKTLPAGVSLKTLHSCGNPTGELSPTESTRPPRHRLQSQEAECFHEPEHPSGKLAPWLHPARQGLPASSQPEARPCRRPAPLQAWAQRTPHPWSPHTQADLWPVEPKAGLLGLGYKGPAPLDAPGSLAGMCVGMDPRNASQGCTQPGNATNATSVQRTQPPRNGRKASSPRIPAVSTEEAGCPEELSTSPGCFLASHKRPAGPQSPPDTLGMGTRTPALLPGPILTPGFPSPTRRNPRPQPRLPLSASWPHAHPDLAPQSQAVVLGSRPEAPAVSVVMGTGPADSALLSPAWLCPSDPVASKAADSLGFPISQSVEAGAGGHKPRGDHHSLGEPEQKAPRFRVGLPTSSTAPLVQDHQPGPPGSSTAPSSPEGATPGRQLKFRTHHSIPLVQRENRERELAAAISASPIPMVTAPASRPSLVPGCRPPEGAGAGRRPPALLTGVREAACRERQKRKTAATPAVFAKIGEKLGCVSPGSARQVGPPGEEAAGRGGRRDTPSQTLRQAGWVEGRGDGGKLRKELLPAAPGGPPYGGGLFTLTRPITVAQGSTPWPLPGTLTFWTAMEAGGENGAT